MSNQLYTDITMDHFKCPRNIGRMDDADGVGMVGDPACGDFLTIYIKVEGEVIQNISYLIFGCAAAIASGSMTTELAKGKTLGAAMKITEEDISEELGGLPANKMHCSNLGVGALRSAIEDYYHRKGRNN